MPAQRRSHAGRIIALALGGVVVLAGGTYAAGYYMAGDKLPARTNVNGIGIGGVDRDGAIKKLAAAMDEQATAPIMLTAGDKRALIKPAEAGMTIDYAATVDQAGAGRSWHPQHIWNVLRGGGSVKPVLVVDQAKLEAAVKAATPTFETKPVDAKLAITDAKPVVTPGKDAQGLDVAKTVPNVRAAWMTDRPVTATLTTIEPELTTKEAQEVADKQLTPLLAAPVVVDTGKGKISLDGKVLAAATTITPKDGNFTVATDTKRLWSQVEEAAKQLGFSKPVNAKVEIVGGRPTVVPSKDGQELDKAIFDKAIASALQAEGQGRTIVLPMTKKEAEITTAEVAQLGVKEVTGEFTTYFPYAEYRNTNLSLAAASINNSFVAPGEVFSLNDVLGPKGPGSGYVDGWVISGDKLEKQNAGGVSQSGTTVFNAIFFAGLEDVEHHPHTMYFDRYPAGREATLYYGSLDVKFRNDTPYGVVLEAYVNKAVPGGQGSITVKVWSTKVYTAVKSSELRKSNFTDGRKIRSKGAKCHPQAASKGFTVNYERLFYKGATLVKTEPFRWTYSPTDEIICE